MRTITFKEVSEVIISVAGLEEDENIQQITESIRKHTQKRRAANVCWSRNFSSSGQFFSLISARLGKVERLLYEQIYFITYHKFCSKEHI